MDRQQQRHFILIASPEGLTAHDYVHDLSSSLRQFGHDVEIWTVRRGIAEPSAEVSDAGNVIRRFRGYREHSVPRVRPCAWVAEWVTCATAHLQAVPGVAAACTLVSFDWEPGVAGRLLAQRFGIDLVHVPCIPELPAAQHTSGYEAISPESWRRSCRGGDEDRETCRFASTVIATTPDQEQLLNGCARHVAYVPAGADVGARFVAALPFAAARVLDTTLRLAELATADPLDAVPAASSTGRGPWLCASTRANYAFAGTESIL
jgi:hypothetical protein